MAESTVIVLVCKDEKAAERLFDTLEETLNDGSFPVDDAAVAIYEQNGEVIVKQMVQPLSENGFNPRLWEFLIKTLLSGWGSHFDNWFIERFRQLFQPGTSAFLTLVEPYASRDLILRFRDFKGNLIYSGLTEEQKTMLKAAASRSS